MITIDKKVRVSKTNQKVEFDLDNLPEGEYEMHLLIDTDNKLSKKIDFGSWSSDIAIPAHLTFSREEIYNDNGR